MKPIFEIEGGKKLKGTLHVSGAKNGALPLMAATLLTREKVRLRRVPRVEDVHTMIEVLRNLGVTAEWKDPHSLDLQVKDESSCWAPVEYTNAMRASICVLGPMLARRGVAHFAPPGGCDLGIRKIDVHLKGLHALGARVAAKRKDITATARRLAGATIDLRVPSGSTVLGTANVMSAAVLAKGRTVIENAALEPEVCDLAEMLNKMGARISGAGTGCLVIEGVKELRGVEWEIIPDRIEAGTYMVAAAITGGDVLLRGVRREHMEAVFAALERMGVLLTPERDGWRVKSNGRFRSTDIVTECFPGFPTDMQAQVMALMCLAEGTSSVVERIFPARFAHVKELKRLGARISESAPSAKVTGVGRLRGAHVTATDLRASAALVLAGLVAQGTTVVEGLEHIDRGYERIEQKLSSLGAEIRRVHV